MDCGFFQMKVLEGMVWQLYVLHFAQTFCTMISRTHNLVEKAHVSTIVMCNVCRLLKYQRGAAVRGAAFRLDFSKRQSPDYHSNAIQADGGAPLVF